MTDAGWGRARGFDALVIASPAATATTLEAVALAGGRGRAVGWDESVAAVEAASERPVLLLVTEGAGAAELADTLAAIDAAAGQRGLMIVATLAAADIDPVAAALAAPGAQLLCAPDAVELAVALMAAGGIDAPAIGVREDDGERLARLHDEIARIAEVLARLGRREGPVAGEVADRRRNFATAPPPAAPVRLDPQVIRDAIRARRLRNGFFPAVLFEDPAWDILLDLFAAELEGTRVSVSSLCIAAAVAPTTALRWISRMTDAGLLDRAADPLDKRRAFVTLSEQAQAGMRGYLAAVSTGLAIV